MDLYQQRAAGMQAVAEPEEHQGAGHKIGLFGIFFLLACTLILDAISILDVFALDIPIADFIAGFFDILLLLYMTYKGILWCPSCSPSCLSSYQAWTGSLST